MIVMLCFHSPFSQFLYQISCTIIEPAPQRNSTPLTLGLRIMEVRIQCLFFCTLIDYFASALKGKASYGVSGDAGVGVYASEDIEDEETVCAVPARLCLSYPVAYEWVKQFLWFEPDSKVHKGMISVLKRAILIFIIAMCLYLLFMNEKYNNPTSFWKPMFGMFFDDLQYNSQKKKKMCADALPDEYSIPLFWSDKALALLNGTPMRGTGTTAKSEILHKTAATARVLRTLRRNYDAIVGGVCRV